MSIIASRIGLAAYASLRMPLALLELPLFVLLPSFYSQSLGLELAVIGAVLFGARLLDALADPLIGASIDRSRSRWSHRQWVWAALPILVIGFWAMLSPPRGASAAQLAGWLAATSMATYLAYSAASIAYQAWGAQIGASERERARVTGTREAFGLVGVVAAAALLTPGQAPMLVLAFASLAAAAALALRWAPTGVARPVTVPWREAWRTVGANNSFRWLLGAFVLNGIATAIPATLLLFFVRDVLHAEAQIPLFLVSYFLAGAAGMPMWIALAGRIGLRNAWLLGMAFAVLAFAWTLGLGHQDVRAFWLVCVLTGLALGADLAMPPALLATVIDAHGDGDRHEGAYFGVWNLATKLNLAAAAGLGLPLLALLGYRPGPGAEGTLALALGYAALPSALKLAAGAVLLLSPMPQPNPRQGAPT
ncbi:MAG: MFS transporter [Burkholderiales bacterium]|nr:MAG: MFS transporter [Burkholderiales bacterium]